MIFTRFILVCLTFLLPPNYVYAQNLYPHFIDPNYTVDLPDLSDLPRLRFLTTLDYPPFNFADEHRKITGINIDLARELCRTIALEDRCEIQALPWNELHEALSNGRGEAIIAGTALTAQNRAQYALTSAYFRLPARFIGQKNSLKTFDKSLLYEDIRIGVVNGTTHQTMLNTYFDKSKIVPFSDIASLYNKVKSGDIDLAFGDGVTFSFWLLSPSSENCCQFFNGPYYNSEFLGEGMAIAVNTDNPKLLNALNHGLSIMQLNGKTHDIFARYLPLNPFISECTHACETATEAPK